MSSTAQSVATAFCGWPAPTTATIYEDKQQQQQNTKDETTLAIPRSLLHQLIQDHHTVYHMEHRDHPNLLARVLVALHELGANQAQLINGYYKVYPDLVPLLQTSIEQRVLTDDSWLEHLGDPKYYRPYLTFFQRKIEEYGMDQVVQQYFFDSPLSSSIGSQLQPIVHMAFGLEYDMPDVVTQGLAYLATTFVDVASLLNVDDEEEEEDHSSNERQRRLSTTTTTTMDHESLLFDMIAADPRFGGRMDGTNTFHSALKVLIKSQQSLLGMYMRQNATQVRLQDLVTLAARLIPCTKQAHRLDWFLGGGQLLASALAIQYLMERFEKQYNNKKLVRLQFLATLCTFIVQGRPTRPPTSHYDARYVHSEQQQQQQLSWDSCGSTVVASGDPKSVLILQSLVKARRLYGNGEEEGCYLDIANFIAGFVQRADGAWCKTDDRSVR
ncbi:hypothetical protein BDB00DRAFT_927243 [Zychaea mexicana]|uniref:uncharacterized protein n=1 Tax=Zychaea mexicana TaxID=64656 RepID=UPI0022FED781|nr:uncharacterized protein BDB00DRAFT_927243 [Zychaea mexicana]KAI9495607.1 hypothetical protein BDB00DRAFT_927243 [Zychaea mexicana]